MSRRSKYRTVFFPCVLLLYRSINLSLLPTYTGILALFHKHNKSAEFVSPCARSPWSHRLERNICRFVYEVSIQNDFQYFLLFFIPFILSSVWFFHQLSWVKPKVQSWQKFFDERKNCRRDWSLQERSSMLWMFSVFLALSVDLRGVYDFFYEWGSLVRQKEK